MPSSVGSRTVSQHSITKRIKRRVFRSALPLFEEVITKEKRERRKGTKTLTLIYTMGFYLFAVAGPKPNTIGTHGLSRLTCVKVSPSWIDLAQGIRGQGQGADRRTGAGIGYSARAAKPTYHLPRGT